MSHKEKDLKIEEADIGIKPKEKKTKYIKDKAIITFLMQHNSKERYRFISN